MSDGEVDLGRRRLLTVATAVTGGIGAATLAAPFVLSFKPSARAKAVGAPVKADISKLDMGSLLRVEWRGKPVYIMRRSQKLLDTLRMVEPQLRDPNSSESIQPPYATNQTRSIKPELLVVLGVCTHLGCAPAFQPQVGTAGVTDEYVAFNCACHGSKFDISGRVFKDVPAPTNLTVPPYRMIDDSWLLIGDDSGVAA